jgi:hypothetical protein
MDNTNSALARAALPQLPICKRDACLRRCAAAELACSQCEMRHALAGTESQQSTSIEITRVYRSALTAAAGLETFQIYHAF